MLCFRARRHHGYAPEQSSAACSQPQLHEVDPRCHVQKPFGISRTPCLLGCVGVCEPVLALWLAVQQKFNA